MSAQIFFVLPFYPPKNQNFDFFRLLPQNQILKDIKKTGIWSINLCTNSRCTKFQANIFIFGCSVQWSKKQMIKVMTSLFETIFWAFLIFVCQNKWHFWNSETRLDRKGMFWKEIFGILFLFSTEVRDILKTIMVNNLPLILPKAFFILVKNLVFAYRSKIAHRECKT